MVNPLDGIRRHTLDQVDRADRRFKGVIAVAALVEGALLGSFLMVMDFGDRLHWLLLLSALLVYGTLSVGLVALGVAAHRNTLKVLKALELGAARPGDDAIADEAAAEVEELLSR